MGHAPQPRGARGRRRHRRRLRRRPSLSPLPSPSPSPSSSLPPTHWHAHCCSCFFPASAQRAPTLRRRAGGFAAALAAAFALAVGMARGFGRGRGRSPGAPAPLAVFARRRGGMLGKLAPPRAAPLEPKCRRTRRTRVSEALSVAARGGSRTCRTCQQGPTNRTNLIGLSVTDSQVSWYDLRNRPEASNRTKLPDCRPRKYSRRSENGGCEHGLGRRIRVRIRYGS